MLKPDVEVQEVLCSETGKPMPKIPLWMADIRVKFVSDEARQKSSPVPGLLDLEAGRKSLSTAGDLDELKEVDVAGVVIDDAEVDEYEDADAEEVPEDELAG
jgi:hypothetical protein